MEYALRLTTPPTAFILTLAEARKHLNIGAGFTDDDAYITNCIEDAHDAIEDITGRALTTQTWTLTRDKWPAGGVIRLTRCPVISVTSVRYKDDDGTLTTLVDGTDYQVDISREPGRILVEPGESWPNLETGRANAVEVIYVAGYGAAGSAAPAAFRRAARLLVGEFYEQREEATDGRPRRSVPIGIRRLLSPKWMPLL